MTSLSGGINRQVLFTSGRPHYAAVWEIRRLLNCLTRAERIKLLTTLALCILQFCIKEDWFLFCRQKTTKADITGAVLNFPQSYLMATVEDLARNIVHVPANFPRGQLQILRGASVPTDTEGCHIERGLGLLIPPSGTLSTSNATGVQIDEDTSSDSEGWSEGEQRGRHHTMKHTVK